MKKNEKTLREMQTLRFWLW